jgi:hypothetical protein
MIAYRNSAVVFEKIDAIVRTSGSDIVEFDHVNTPEKAYPNYKNLEKKVLHIAFSSEEFFLESIVSFAQRLK